MLFLQGLFLDDSFEAISADGIEALPVPKSNIPEGVDDNYLLPASDFKDPNSKFTGKSRVVSTVLDTLGIHIIKKHSGKQICLTVRKIDTESDVRAGSPLSSGQSYDAGVLGRILNGIRRLLKNVIIYNKVDI